MFNYKYHVNSIFSEWLKFNILFLFLFMGLFVTFAIWIIFSRLDSNIQSLLDHSLTITWDEYSDYFTKSSSVLSVLSSDITSANLKSIDSGYSYLPNNVINILRDQKDFDLWLIIDNNGNIVASNASNQKDEPGIINDIFQACIKDGQPVIDSEVIPFYQLYLFSPSLAERALPKNTPHSTNEDIPALFQITAFPFKNNDNKIIGVLMAGHLLNNNNSVADNVSMKIPNSFSTISSNNILISGNISGKEHPTYIGMIQNQDLAQTTLEGKRYFGRVKFGNDLDHLVASDPIRNYKGNIVGALTVGQPSEGLASLKMDTIRYILLSALFCLIIAFGVSAFSSKKGSTPIVNLANIARGIYHSNSNSISFESVTLTNDMKISSILEIRELQQCFIKMTKWLYEKIEENHTYLEELENDRRTLTCLTQELQDANSSLEIKVSEKTMELTNAVSELKTLNNLKNKFLANMSHELRTPLNAIIGFSEMLYDELFGKLTNKQHGHAKIILDSSHHLLELINDILDLSLIDQGKICLEKEMTNLNEIISNILKVIANEANNKDINISFAQLTKLPDVYVDPIRIKQIFYNILSNALKFTHPGGSINIQTSLSGNHILISVEDTGIGIDDKDQLHVFDEFYQCENIYSKKSEGVGLGLPLSKHLTELHNGRIELQSIQGKGTTVKIYIPV
jgi:signal transduction histidine kinase